MLVPQYFKPVLCAVFYASICQKLHLLEIASKVIVYSGVQKQNVFIICS